MAKNVLPTNFQDDIMDGMRKYRMINNIDGTVSFEDVTNYAQEGSNFGSAQINATNQAVNESADKNKIIDSLNAIKVNTSSGYIAGALAVKDIANAIVVVSFDSATGTLVTKTVDYNG